MVKSDANMCACIFLTVPSPSLFSYPKIEYNQS